MREFKQVQPEHARKLTPHTGKAGKAARHEWVPECADDRRVSPPTWRRVRFLMTNQGVSQNHSRDSQARGQTRVAVPSVLCLLSLQCAPSSLEGRSPGLRRHSAKKQPHHFISFLELQTVLLHPAYLFCADLGQSWHSTLLCAAFSHIDQQKSSGQHIGLPAEFTTALAVSSFVGASENELGTFSKTRLGLLVQNLPPGGTTWRDQGSVARCE